MHEIFMDRNINMEKLSGILKRLIAQQEITISQLARSTGILQPVLHRMTTGDTNNPRIDTLLPLANYFNISIEQLIGQVPLSQKNISRHFPLIKWDKLTLSKKRTDDTTVYFQSEKNVSADAFFLYVKDSTMTPLFNEDALLLIDPSIKPKNKDYVIVSVENQREPMLRQLWLNGSEAYLKPLNPLFKTIFLDQKRRHRFLGVVIDMLTTLRHL